MKDELESNGKMIKILFFVAIILVVILVVIIISANKEKQEIKEKQGTQKITQVGEEKESANKIAVLPTMLDDVEKDSSWCGTFQLVWNDMCNEIVGGDVIFTDSKEIGILKNLNKQAFTEKDISDEYYFKKWGFKNLELKKEIEKGIKEKFNETSDVLDKLSWDDENLDDPNNPDVSRYLFYAMLKRDFKFEKKFTILENGTFGKDYEDVKYFGIDEKTDTSVRKQVNVLYYNSETDFAVELKAKEDRVVLVRNAEGKNFDEIYTKMTEKAEKYTGKTGFGKDDTLKIPNLNIDVLREYTELEGKEFKVKNGKGKIENAIQTIQMQLDHTGGSVKSEAVVDMITFSAIITEAEPRHFDFDGEFTVFFKEEEKDKPYFAANVSNIKLFQD